MAHETVEKLRIDLFVDVFVVFESADTVVVLNHIRKVFGVAFDYVVPSIFNILLCGFGFGFDLFVPVVVCAERSFDEFTCSENVVTGHFS